MNTKNPLRHTYKTHPARCVKHKRQRLGIKKTIKRIRCQILAELINNQHIIYTQSAYPHRHFGGVVKLKKTNTPADNLINCEIASELA